MRAFKEELNNTFGAQNRRGVRSKSSSTHMVQGVKMELNKESHSDADAHSEGTWIFSFADLIMNLLMFFVMMFAISSVDKGKFQEFQEAFSNRLEGAPKLKEKSQTSRNLGSESSYAASTGVSSTKEKMSNAEILENVKNLVAQIDKQKIEKSKIQKFELSEMNLVLKNLEEAVNTEIERDPFANSFEITFFENRILAQKNGLRNIATNPDFSSEGKHLIKSVVTELQKLNKPLFIWVRGHFGPDLVAATVFADKFRKELIFAGLSEETNSFEVSGHSQPSDRAGVVPPSKIVIKISTSNKKPKINQKNNKKETEVSP
jgi:flagellar motor protein MotB